MKHTKLSKTLLAVVSASSLVGAPRGALAQDIDLGILCTGSLQDDYVVLANTFVPSWLTGTFTPALLTAANLDGTWSNVIGGPGTFDPARGLAADKYIVANLLTIHGLDTQAIPVSQDQSGYWDYDPAAFYLTRNHNELGEYARLSDSRELKACIEINHQTGDPLCGPYCDQNFLAKLCSAPTYGRKSTVSLVGYDSSGDYGFNNGFGHLSYHCPAFDDSYGAAVIATTIIHEKFHSIESHGHENCAAMGPGRCAKEWDFDLPGSPTHYNELATFQAADAYQIGYRYSCDLVEAPAEWMPVMAQILYNEYANKLQAEPRYLNIAPLTGGGDAGPAPYACGLPKSVLGLVVGDVCPGGGTRCDSDADCASGYECNNLCCEEEVIIH